MKRIFLLFFALASLCMSGYSTTLTPEEALQRAGKTGMRKTRGLNTQTLQLSYTLNTEKGDAAVYIFNSSNNEGFMILSADNQAAPVLGYTDSGEFDPNNIPDQMQWWLEQYARQIEYAHAYNLSSSEINPTKSDWKSIEPMIKTKWNQSEPFNNDCPIDPTTGKRCVTGCVATAMAQIMNYWKMPERGTGSVSYTPSGFKSPLTMDFSTQKFDWENMLDKYEEGKYNETQAAAVAYLMKACGYSVNMTYSSEGSGTRGNLLSGGLIDNFGYNKNISYEQRDYYSSDDWNQMVYDELTVGRPVLYTGASDNGGHAFICDGYADGFFHINWGWGGMVDGYFLLESLVPSSQGIGGNSFGYNYNQAILKCVQPSECENPDSFAMEQDGNLSATVDGNKINPLFSGATSAGIWYSQNSTINIYMAMEISSVDNPNYKTLVGLYSLQNFGPKTYRWVTRLPSFDFPATLVDGTYRCRIVVRNVSQSNSEWVYVRNMPGAAYYFNVKKSGNSLTIENIAPQSIKIIDAKIAKEVQYQRKTEISLTFANPNDIQLNSTIRPDIFNANGQKLLEGQSVTVMMNPGETTTKVWSSTFNLAYGASVPTTDFSGYIKFTDIVTGIYYDFQIPVSVRMSDPPNPSILSLKIADSKKETVNGVKNVWVVTDPASINVTFSLSNSKGYYNYPTYLYIAEANSDIIIKKTEVNMPGVKAGDFEILTGIITFGEAEEEKLYKLGVLYIVPGETSEVVMTSANFLVRYPSSVNEIDNETVGVEEYYDLQGRKLNSTPERGIYIVKRGDKVSKIIK